MERKAPKTFKANLKQVRRAKTVRVGRRGLHELDDIYRGLSGFGIQTIGLSGPETTYGEVANQGISVLAEVFKRHAPPSKFSAANRNFFDLGCGIGRLVVGIAAIVPEIHSNGIEIVSDRVRISQIALGRISSKQLASRIQIRQGNFLDAAISYRSVCWIFLSNLSFSHEFQRSLAERFERECIPGCVIICIRELPFSVGSHIEKVDMNFTVPMTWSAGSTCIAYKKRSN